MKPDSLPLDSLLARALGAALALLASSGCETATIPGDAGLAPVGDAGWLSDGDAATDAGADPAPGLAIYPVRPFALVDTREAAGPCGAHVALDADPPQVEVALRDCAGLALPEGTLAIAATLTVIPRDPEVTVEVRAGAPAAIATQPVVRAGPRDAWTSGVLTSLGPDLTLRIEASQPADLVVELTALLAPPGPGARGAQLLPRPLRLYAARWDEAGIWHGPTRAGVDQRLALNEIEEDPLGALPGDLVGLLGVAHVGPDGLCEPGSSVSLGPARPEGATDGLARIATCAPDATFPRRDSTPFVIGASASQQLALRADGADANVYLDVVAILVPYREGAALYHPLPERLRAEIELGSAAQRVDGRIAGASGLSGRVTARSRGAGELAIAGEPSGDAPSGVFATLALQSGAERSAWFATALDADGTFFLESEAPASLQLSIDGYWAP